MTALTVESTTSPVPRWLWATSVVGVAWNLYGVYQFAGSFTPTGQAAMTAGMTSVQAAVYLSLPDWISVAFGVGVLAGLIGSMLLTLRRRLAQPVLAASLAGYSLLFAGDAYYGVFTAIPGQLAILGVVVLIAIALSGASRLAGKRGLLR